MEATTLAQALRQALIEEMRRDNWVVLLGEDIGKFLVLVLLLAGIVTASLGVNWIVTILRL